MIELKCDVLIIGGGAAGSRAAYESRKAYPNLTVFLAVTGNFGESGSSNLVASEALGINAPFNYMNDGDTTDIYYHDTVMTGGGLGDAGLCRIIADESCRRVQELMDLGVGFEQQDGRPLQKLLSGCTKARSLTCGGSTARYMVKALKQAGLALGVKVFEHTRILKLAQDRDGKVCGAYGLLGEEEVCFAAGAVILATGGAGRIFKKNVNPPAQEGDGWAMAYEAGAQFVNMEFFQIGPAVVKPEIDFIIHSHMWRLKPKLTNVFGKEFLSDYCQAVDPQAALDAKAMSYPFSVRTDAKYVDIAIFKELMTERGTDADGIYFDVTHVGRDELQARAPITYETLKKAGADLANQPIELGLVVQNFNGGILIDENGFTGVPGLFAAGEVTGGVHGSDRPGGNNLTDTQVFGYRAGVAAARYANENQNNRSVVPLGQDQQGRIESDATERDVLRVSESLFYKQMTIVRTGEGLQTVLDFIDRKMKEDISLVLKNRLLVGKILAMAMLTREESRGTHYREDFPVSSPSWNKRIIIRKGRSGMPKITIET